MNSFAPYRQYSGFEMLWSEEITQSPDFAAKLANESEEIVSAYSDVWITYNEESSRCDTSLVEGCNRDIDVLLVFTGLFSAVLTTFIIQAYDLMVPDATDFTNDLLMKLITLQEASSEITESPLSVSSVGPSSPKIQWINGLWFTSLCCSLSTALVSMLAKHWLQAYIPDASGSPRQRARLRQYRFMKMEEWHLLHVVNALPLLLHISLLLFFSGLLVLLWSTTPGIVVPAFLIIALAYGFYFGSLWTPVFAQRIFFPDLSFRPPEDFPSLITSRNTSQLKTGPAMDDILDAHVLIWLFERSKSESIASIALKAIGGLPRDFRAFHILRDAGAISLVLRGFEGCYHRDNTAGETWYLTQPEEAVIYCRAWLRLTRDVGGRWPEELVDPLDQIQDAHVHGAATASCIRALSHLDRVRDQWEVLALLSRIADRQIQVSLPTQCLLLDTLLECTTRWELSSAGIQETIKRAIPTLLRLLEQATTFRTSNTRGTIGLTLYSLAMFQATVDLSAHLSENSRLEAYCEKTLLALSAIAEDPKKYGVNDELLDLVASELSRLASHVLSSRRFLWLRQPARLSLFKLYLDGRVGVGKTPDHILADVLQLLFSLDSISEKQYPLFVSTLTKTISLSFHPPVYSCCARLLEPLLSGCTAEVIKAFIDADGVHALTKVAHAGNMDSRRLQLESVRTLCAFIKSSTVLYFQESKQHQTKEVFGIDYLFGPIFRSDFFQVLCQLLGSQRWWVPEVVDMWVPALIQLCRICPDETVWSMIEGFLRKFAEYNQGQDEYLRLITSIDIIWELRKLSLDQQSNSISYYV
ncbi:hypothetical protein BDQ17DRAFT_1346767 [Cyathus striatus]|nr:hypothetical protein BDQ17DRAFT_1346767 [Cyathus striatus]